MVSYHNHREFLLMRFFYPYSFCFWLQNRGIPKAKACYSNKWSQGWKTILETH